MTRVALSMLAISLLVTGCAETRARRDAYRAQRNAELEAKQKEWEHLEANRPAELEKWTATHPGEVTPWKLSPTPRLSASPDKEARFTALTAYFGPRIGLPEDKVLEDPPLDECSLERTSGRRYSKECRFRFNYPDRSPKATVTLRFEDGKLANWDFD